MVEGLVISLYEETETHERVHELVKDRPLVHRQKFSAGRYTIQDSVQDRDPGLDELIERNLNSIMREVRKVGERVGANVAILYPRRGFGRLRVNAHYFSLSN